MMRCCRLQWVMCALLLVVWPPMVGAATVGSQVELKARHHAGVPLHQTAGGKGTFQRVPDGTVAAVTAVVQQGRWLQLTLPDGRSGWIADRYVGRTLSGEATPSSPPLTAAERQVWGSVEGCRQALEAGDRLERPAPSTLRIGTWNLRWFPRGCHPTESCPENATDGPWLACTITWMQVDLLGVQEVLTTPEAQAALQTLRTELDRLTGGTWQIDLQACGGPMAQHVGYLWNQRRVSLTQMTDVWELNASATEMVPHACANRLRPARYAAAKTPAGVDVDLLVVHLDSGTANRDYQHRRQASDRLGRLAITSAPLLGLEPDILVLGDFNTMGRLEAPPISAIEEVAAFDQDLEPGFRRLPATMACTEYHEGKGQSLDYVVAGVGMEEVMRSARVTGYCAVAACADLTGAMPAAYERLSDHCPVLVDVHDEDRD